MSEQIQVTVLYPSEGLQFNEDYYRTKHMPMVLGEWKAHGMTGFKVTTLNGIDGKDGPFKVMTTMDFDTVDHIKAAIAQNGDKVMGDVPNFSNNKPVIMIGRVQASG